eukprot:NODE_3140_length_1272_cov_136.834639_g2981_i0.p1 GENE.NODE_3140_length_1272_cov_136.834639_g2981_i0~~NODE_3140_length_1272_cov_136.834639_g2981_i0.p1  ORF type:complete len:328 (-),score=75.09 NODE_3140_length_1272_cov_136.834639_g2981_i0:230-1213(-)
MAGVPALFVGGLSPDTTEAELRRVFDCFGIITNITMKGKYAFITYNSIQCAQAACTMDGQMLGSRKLGVRIQGEENKKHPYSRPIKDGAGYAPLMSYIPPSASNLVPALAPAALSDPHPSLFVGSLAHDVTDADLKALFGNYGTISKLTMKKGYAFIGYDDPNSAPMACELNGQELHGKAMAVRVQSVENAKKVVTQPAGGMPSFAPQPQMMPSMGNIPASAPTVILPQGPPSPYPSLFVGGIAETVSDRDLMLLFAPHGAITNITRKKKYAFIDYNDPGASQSAVRMLDGFIVDNVPLAVRLQDATNARTEKSLKVIEEKKRYGGF